MCGWLSLSYDHGDPVAVSHAVLDANSPNSPHYFRQDLITTPCVKFFSSTDQCRPRIYHLHRVPTAADLPLSPAHLFFPTNHPMVMNLEETVRELEDRLGMSRSEEVEETGRMVARLQD